jgi:hypothetical protein
MSRAARHNLLTFFLLTLTVVLFWYPGCSTGYYGDIDYSSGGTFKVKVSVPAHISTDSRVIPEGTTSLRVRIDSSETSYSSTTPIPLTGAVVSAEIPNVPVGLHVATFEAVNASNTVLAQRKHGFYMPPGATVNAGTIDLGVAIQSNGLVTPQIISIQQGATLYIENWDTGSDRVVELSSSSSPATELYTTGTINRVTALGQPVSPKSYNYDSILFNTIGDFYFMTGHGGNNSSTYRVNVGPANTVSGRVVYEQEISGLTVVSPVIGAKVTVGGLTVLTNRYGYYTVQRVIQLNNQELTVEAPGFAPYNDTINITQNVTELDDIVLSQFVNVVAGESYCLALDSSGFVWSWGLNSDGVLGDGTTVAKSTPVQVKVDSTLGGGNLSGIIDIASNSYFSMALKSDGTVWTWGYNSYGELGNGITGHKNAAVKVVKPADEVGYPDDYLIGIIKIAAGRHHGMALDTQGRVWTWGRNSNGQLGYGVISGSSTARRTPIQAGHTSFTDGIVDIAAGRLNGFAIDSSGVTQ